MYQDVLPARCAHAHVLVNVCSILLSIRYAKWEIVHIGRKKECSTTPATARVARRRRRWLRSKFWFVSSQQRHLQILILMLFLLPMLLLFSAENPLVRARDARKFVVLRWEKWILRHKECNEMLLIALFHFTISHTRTQSEIEMNTCMIRLSHYSPRSPIISCTNRFLRAKLIPKLCIDTKTFFTLATKNSPATTAKRAILPIYAIRKLWTKALEILHWNFYLRRYGSVSWWWCCCCCCCFKYYYQEQSKIYRAISKLRILSEERKQPFVIWFTCFDS